MLNHDIQLDSKQIALLCRILCVVVCTLQTEDSQTFIIPHVIIIGYIGMTSSAVKLVLTNSLIRSDVDGDHRQSLLKGLSFGNKLDTRRNRV